MDTEVFVKKIDKYDSNFIYENLEDSIFNRIYPSDCVVLKPNFIKQSHLRKPDEWDYVITHPTVITAVLMKVLSRLEKGAKIIITDGPQTDSSFEQIIDRYPVSLWLEMCVEKGINLEIIDLRDDEWVQKDDVTVKRTKLKGDPKGKTEVNLINDLSSFWRHNKSCRGYYGADYNLAETNEAHDGTNNKYKVSRSVIEGDVFINLPKLKTHKKAGITCCLKNLVGINTYKNYLPHHSEGAPSEGGDQFSLTNINAKLEGPLLAFLKQNLLQRTIFASLFRPFRRVGKKVFGDTQNTIRSGNWYGNDTIWRTIIDLNKILFYANSDGSLKEDSWVNAKRYIGIVDAIIAGEGNGPLEPDPVAMGYIFCGTNPVAIDAVCAKFMGFDPDKIPSIKNSFNVEKYKLCTFNKDNVIITLNNYKYSLNSLPQELVVFCKPHFGWSGHIESEN